MNNIRHICPIIFTITNVLLTIMFTIIIVPYIQNIDDVGYVRYSIMSTDMCLHKTFEHVSTLNESMKCISTNLNNVEETLDSLSYLKAFPQRYIFSTALNTYTVLVDNFSKYKAHIYLSIVKGVLSDSDSLVILELSENVVRTASLYNKDYIHVFGNILISIALMMATVVFIQIFYN